MQCRDFEQRLQVSLDERRQPDWDIELRLHGQECARCRDLAAAFGAMMEGLQALPEPTAPSDLAARVVAELNREPVVLPAGRVRRWAGAAAAMATAATVLFAVGTTLRWSFTPPNQQVAVATVAPQAALATPAAKVVESPAPIAVATNDTPSAQESAIEEAPAVKSAAKATKRRGTRRRSALALTQIPLLQVLPALKHDKKNDPYAKLAQQTGRGLGSLLRGVPGVAVSQVSGESGGQQSDAIWTTQMNRGIAPMTDSVADALNLLFRATPPEKATTRS